MSYFLSNGSERFIFLNESSETCNPQIPNASTSDKALMTTGYVILLFVSLAGNALIIAVFFKKHDQLQTPVNYFIINMAVSDFLVPIFVLPRRIQEVYLGWGPWLVSGVLGDIICKVASFADEVSITVSSQSMVFIASERLSFIVFQHKRPFISNRTTPFAIVFTWLFSTVFYSYYLFAYKVVAENKTTVCIISLPHFFHSWQDLWRVDRLVLLLVFVVIPFILMLVFYTTIVVTLRRQVKDAIHLSLKVQKRRAKQTQRITLMLISVVAVFVISWTPYYIYFFLHYYSLGSNLSCETIKRLWFAGYYMNYIYTALNPLIYYTFNPIYRHGLHELLGCPWSCYSRRQMVVEPVNRQSNGRCQSGGL